MHGAATTSYVALAESPVKGSKQLVLAEMPVGWDPGERIVVTGTSASKNQDEELEIASVATVGGKIIVNVTTPLLFNNPLLAGQSIYVTNVSRNVTVQSLSVARDAAPRPRDDHAQPARGDRVRRLLRPGPHGQAQSRCTTWSWMRQGVLVPGTGKNVVGRYAVHFHRTGLDHHAAPVAIRGSAVVDSPGWGIVNHSSNVLAEGNTVFDVIGAAYVTETGDEIGAFRNNIAIRSTGSGAGIESREDRQDFGHQGDGFWFQGAGIEVEGNIAAGQRHSGFVYFTQGLVQTGLGTTRFLAHNLVNEAWAGGQEYYRRRQRADPAVQEQRGLRLRRRLRVVVPPAQRQAHRPQRDRRLEGLEHQERQQRVHSLHQQHHAEGCLAAGQPGQARPAPASAATT